MITSKVQDVHLINIQNYVLKNIQF